ncbi:MAG: hypothetical protein KDC75_21905, partial [Phaeodactylibacter sp.]|nr:hypothetical protein [Phaeodactylibacter sp.]
STAKNTFILIKTARYVHIKSWKKLMKEVRAPFPFIFFVIVGTSALCVYEGNLGTGKLRKLNEHAQKDWIDWLFE